MLFTNRELTEKELSNLKNNNLVIEPDWVLVEDYDIGEFLNEFYFINGHYRTGMDGDAQFIYIDEDDIFEPFFNISEISPEIKKYKRKEEA